MDQLEAMRIFAAVVECHGFSAASRRLGIPVPTVSRKVAQLEEKLEGQLLIRTTRKLTVTPAGDRYYRDVCRIIEEIDHADLAVTGDTGQLRGTLVVTAPILFGHLHVRPLVQGFMRSHPGIRFVLRFSDLPQDYLEDQIDFGIRIGGDPGDAISARLLGTVRQLTCGSPDYFDQRGRPATPEELLQHDTVNFSNSGSSRPWVFRHPARGYHEIGVRPRLIVNTASDAVGSATEGLGIAQLYSYQVAEPIRKALLEVVLRDFEIEPLPVYLLVSGGRTISRKLGLLMDHLSTGIAARLDEIDAVSAR